MQRYAALSEYELGQQLFLNDQLRLSESTNRDLMQQLNLIIKITRGLMVATLLLLHKNVAPQTNNDTRIENFCHTATNTIVLSEVRTNIKCSV